MKALHAVLLTYAVAMIGCGEAVTPEPTGDYTTWKRIETYGEVPGHGDTYRVIYANDIAETFDGTQYAEGSVIVKEIYDNNGGAPGALRYIALMRGYTVGPDLVDALLRLKRQLERGV